MQDEYIAYINQKYCGKISSEPFKKMYSTHGEFLNGKLQSEFPIQNTTIVFTMDVSVQASPYTSAIKISSGLPKKCTLIPRRKIFRLLSTQKSKLRKRYKTYIDSDLLIHIESNDHLSELLEKRPVHVVIKKNRGFRLLVINPYFSVLCLSDF